MRRFFLLVFFFSAINAATQAQELRCNNWQKYVLKTCNDLQKQNLKGQIKNIRSEIENIDHKDGKEIKRARETTLSSNYNETGYLTEESSSFSKTVYQYDSQGRLIRQESDKEIFDFVAKKYVYVYDDNNRKIEITGYAENNVVYSKSVETFAEKGNLTESNYCFENKDPYYLIGISLGKICENTKFDEKERYIERSTLDADGSLFTKYQYIYDNSGKQTVKILYASPKHQEIFYSGTVVNAPTCQNGWWKLCTCSTQNSKLDSKNTCSECDKTGNCIKRINESKKSNENLFVTTNYYRTITYY